MFCHHRLTNAKCLVELVQGPQSTFVFSDVGGHSLKGCHIPSSLCQSEGIKSHVAANVNGMARPPWTDVINVCSLIG